MNQLVKGSWCHVWWITEATSLSTSAISTSRKWQPLSSVIIGWSVASWMTAKLTSISWNVAAFDLEKRYPKNMQIANRPVKVIHFRKLMWRLCNSITVLLATEKIHGVSHLSEKNDILIVCSSFLINMHSFLCKELLCRDFHLSFHTPLEVIWQVVVSLMRPSWAWLSTVNPNNRFKQAYCLTYFTVWLGLSGRLSGWWCLCYTPFCFFRL